MCPAENDTAASDPRDEPHDSLDAEATLQQASDQGGAAPSVRRLGPYRLLHELGRGGQGFVYLAEDERLRRRVALKILPQGQLFGTASRIRFEREAEAASKLDHPGIARVYELGEHEGMPFIAMEYVRGRTLASLIAEAAHGGPRDDGTTEVRLDSSVEATTPRTSSSGGGSADTPRLSGNREALNTVVRFVISAARALHAAHETGLVHRDIKPGNLMVRDDGSACVLDFGLARDDSTVTATLTQTGDVVGTPAYMAPEQVLGQHRRIDRRTDVYALGVSLFEACTLQRPFQGRTRQDLYEAISHREPVAPRRLNPQIDRDLEAIILTAMDKNPDRRYATALGLAEDLERLLRREPVAARPAGPLVKSARWLQRNAAVALAGAAVILALLVAALVFYTKEREASRARDQARAEATRRGEALAAETRERRLKEKALADYERLADVKRLEAANRQADLLFPPAPELIPRIAAWHRDYDPLLTRLPEHEALLADLRGRGQRSADAGWRFEDERLQFQHDVLAELVTDLERFRDDPLGPMKTMARRLELARAIRPATIEDAAAAWRAAARRLAANPRYDGLELPPQLGLIPLGPDPDSGLEEFLHWLSHAGPIPERDAAGRLPLDEEVGIVMVLLPAATALLGSQRDDPALPNYDPISQPDEQPVHPIALAPYFIAKHEIDQAQWLRMFGVNPSKYGAGARHPAFKHPVTLMHPAENLSWNDAMRFLPRVDLDLPTEAEWEHAARAGLNQVWAGTSRVEELVRYANVKGEETRAVGSTDVQVGHVDDFILHAPIGSFRPNAFGLCDMSGNVWEWCLDGVLDRYPPDPGPRGLGADTGPEGLRAFRGGNFNYPAPVSRIALRGADYPDYRSGYIGIRPVRALR
ncbi:MAG: SUMF1/EgtB/PvdO family nonheme iron enzyme [Planctomycetes bacterium]|nr:SUMF1/EgtB/PvdO family nonheme iron enzyme [Planctomycetota bacterium]